MAFFLVTSFAGTLNAAVFVAGRTRRNVQSALNVVGERAAKVCIIALDHIGNPPAGLAFFDQSILATAGDDEGEEEPPPGH